MENLVFLPIVEKCLGCKRVTGNDENAHCSTYLNPGARWRSGHCALASHVRYMAPEVEEKKRVGQQKQKKHK